MRRPCEARFCGGRIGIEHGDVPLPVDTANCRDTVSTCLAKRGNVIRLNAADCDHGDKDGSGDLFDEWNARFGTFGVSWRFEHCSGDAPAGA